MSQAASNQESVHYQELLSKLQDIRTLPVVAMKVNDLINDPNSSSGEIAEVLKKDLVLTAKILRLVNSSYYSIPGGVADVKRALAFLGFNTLAQLVLSLSVFSFFKDVASNEFSMTEFWRHCLAVGVCSEVIAKKIKLPKPEEAFSCGLLHDVGKLVLHEIDPQTFLKIVTETKKRGCSYMDVERQFDLPSHSYIGEIIATKWGLPQSIRLAIRYHHFDVSRMDSILPSIKPVIQVVRLANNICIKNQVGKSGDCSGGTLTPDMFAPLKLRMDDLPEIEDQFKIDMERAGAFLNVNG
jgi:putative nucleotidyltransferase with HDIG domain